MQPLLSARGHLIKESTGIEGRFEILKKLGEGAFGSAYLAVDKASGQRRVLKAVRKQGNVPKEALDQEIAVLKALDHPNIVRIFSYAEDYRFLYIVLEPAEGGELLAVISDIHQAGKFQLNEAWASQVFKQCLLAMVYCHARGVLHKDLKSENIMLLGTDSLEEPHAVIIDFGVAELVSPHGCSQKRRGSLQAGTCTTMAPEVWRGNFGPKCDVWSIGCVLFRVLCGKFPFLAKNLNDASEWLRLHQRGPDWGWLCRVSDNARQLCQKLLVLDERIRPTADQCLRHRWFTHQASVSPALDSEALQTLCELREQSALERAVCMNIAASLNVAGLTPLTEMFHACDRDSDGIVSPEELKVALQHAGLGAEATSQVTQLIQAQGPHVEYTTFLSSLLATCSSVLDESLWREFRRLDKDGSGKLCKNELREVLRGVRDVDAILSDIDTEGDGLISFDEFQEHFRRQTHTVDRPCILEEAAADSTPAAIAPDGVAAGSVVDVPVSEPAASKPAAATANIVTTSATAATEVDMLLDELEVCGLLESEAAGSAPASVPSNVAEALFQRADLDSDGTMSTFEFACWTTKLLQAVRSDGNQVREPCDSLVLDFSKFDRDKDNKLNRTEWQEMLNAVVEAVGVGALRRLAEESCARVKSAGSQRSHSAQKEEIPDREEADKTKPEENEIDVLLKELGL
mmetsp:Transcript_61966/g.113351  ORF Transcript_61966/g.113351 Transcript_61966/m.113351 type:complete len:688 (-) Transcript_61966:107-2170(-)